jgi:ribosomal protein S18 acetylase RimI-like enzyme
MNVTLGFTDADRPAVAALYWDAFGQKLGRIMGPRDRALDFFEAVMNPDHALCARDSDGTLLGVAGFKTAEGSLVGGSYRDMARVYGHPGAVWRMALLSALERDSGEIRFLVDGIFVAADARGRGVGTMLLDAIAQQAALRRCSNVHLVVVDSNERARALYEREGFRVVATHSIGWLRLFFGFRAATTMVRRVAA